MENNVFYKRCSELWESHLEHWNWNGISHDVKIALYWIKNIKVTSKTKISEKHRESSVILVWWLRYNTELQLIK